MRPVKITMCGIGSYFNLTTINMDLLGENGLYLIAGNTGSGKSTIFDAITYALYGESSGTTRNSGLLSSVGVDDTLEKFVELTFVHQGKSYSVRRNFDYSKVSSKGRKTAVKQDAYIILPDESCISGYSKTTAKVIEILGLRREQFTKTVMIAQGEFSEFLRAKTDDKIKILRGLFKTENYQTLLDRLGTMTSLSKSQCDSLRQEQKKIFAYLSANENISCYSEINQIKDAEEILDKDNADKLFNTLLSEQKKQSTDISELINTKQEESDKVKITIAKAQQLNSTINMYNNAIKEQQTILEDLPVLEKKFREEESRQPEKDNIIAKINQLQNTISKYDELDHYNKLISNYNSDYENSQIKAKDTDNKIDVINTDIICLQKTIESLKNSEIDREKLNFKKNSIEKDITEITDIKKQITEIEIIKEKCNNLQQKYIVSSEKMNDLCNLYAQKEKAFFDEQAGILAKKLIDGTPCPVCGSISHPSPRTVTIDAPTEDELNNLKLLKEQHEKESGNLSQMAKSVRTEYEVRKTALIDVLSSKYNLVIHNDNYSDVDKLYSEKNKILSEVNSSILTADQQIAEKNNAQHKLDNQKADYDKYIKQKADISGHIIEINAKLPECTAYRDKLSAELDFESKAEALQHIDILQKSRKDIDDRFVKSKNAYQKCKDKSIELNSEIKTLMLQINGNNTVDIKALTDKSNLLLHELKLSKDRLDEVNMAIKQNERCIADIQKNRDEYIINLTRYNNIKNLYNTANGSVTEKEKLRLEAFVQISYFKRVIARANMRLNKMSDGKLELIAQSADKNLRSQIGLDVSVMDHYCGEIRSVNTLSGGEMFQASLALALGLSDEIQSSSGGIDIDTLFIDEGFGSLSEEARNSSIKVLGALSENRLIGIISHVSELKELIDKKIVVTKNSSGASSVKIEC